MTRPVLHNTNALGLYVPDQTFSEMEAPFSRPREAENWINELPMAAIGETSRQVYKALAQLNRSQVSPQNRLKILELLREPVEYISTSLKKHYIGQPFPLTIKTRKIAELSQELQWEMANGYKIIIDASLSGFNQRVDGKMLLTSLGRAIHYLGQCLLKSYQIYAPAPERIWLELHHLYLFAEHNDLHDKYYRDKPVHGTNNTSILNDYKTIVLLALANPYRLPQAEIEKVASCIQQWSPHSELFYYEADQPSPGLFAINLEQDAPPSYASKQLEANTPALIRILDTTEVARLARNELIALDDDSAPTTCPLSHETLRRLVLALGGMPKRSFSRVNKNTPIHISLGLNATHYFVEQAPVPRATEKYYPLKASDIEQTDMRVQYSDSRFMAPAKFHSRDTGDTPLEQRNQIDIWDLAASPSSGSGKPEPDQLSVDPFLGDFSTRIPDPENQSSVDKPPPAVYKQYDCTMTDESVGGCRLHWQAEEFTKTVVGLLIGVQNPQDTRDAQQSNIGVIRWLKNQPDAGLEMGVEILAPHAIALATRNLTHKSRLGFFVRSLLLPELRAINQPMTLLTPPGYQVGDKLEVRLANGSFRVRLTKLLEQTGTFCQFQFNTLKPLKMTPETGKLDRIKNFDSIWSSI